MIAIGWYFGLVPTSRIVQLAIDYPRGTRRRLFETIAPGDLDRLLRGVPDASRSRARIRPLLHRGGRDSLRAVAQRRGASREPSRASRASCSSGKSTVRALLPVSSRPSSVSRSAQHRGCQRRVPTELHDRHPWPPSLLHRLQVRGSCVSSLPTPSRFKMLTYTHDHERHDERDARRDLDAPPHRRADPELHGARLFSQTAGDRDATSGIPDGEHDEDDTDEGESEPDSLPEFLGRGPLTAVEHELADEREVEQ